MLENQSVKFATFGNWTAREIGLEAFPAEGVIFMRGARTELGGTDA